MYSNAGQIIDALGGNVAFCRKVGITDEHRFRATDFKRRNSIPVAYWPGIIKAGRAEGLPIDANVLVFIHTGQVLRPPVTPEVLASCGIAAIVALMVGFVVGVFLGYLRSQPCAHSLT